MEYIHSIAIFVEKNSSKEDTSRDMNNQFTQINRYSSAKYVLGFTNTKKD